MRRIYSIISAVVIGCISAVAQTVVSGSVANREGEALIGSTVFFIQADTVAGGVTTDGKGRFQLKGLPAGNYECRVSMLGYKPASQKFTLTEKTKLPRFVLEEDAKALAEVTVTVDPRKMTKELAGMSIYYLTDRAKKEPDAYSALREIPRLRVNPVNRSITLDDGSSPLILVNGVKKPLDVILPEMIESVEVIDNPSARFRGDASVTSVLNLRLKKEGVKPYLRGDMNAKSTPNANFIFSNASFELGDATSSIYVTGGYMQIGKNRSESYSDIFQGNLHREESSKSKGSWRNPFAYIGGDKELSKKDYIAFSVKYIPNPTDSKSRTDGTVTDLATGESSALKSEYDSRSRFHEVVGNLYYKHAFKSSRTLEISGDYFYSMNGNNARREERSEIYNYVSDIDLDNSRHMGKLDANYSDMLTKSTHFEAGSNTEYSVTNIDDRLDTNPEFRYRRTREYLYAGLDNNQSRSRFNYVVSLGLDMVFSDASGARHSYIDLVPSVSLSYKFAGRQNLSLLYSRSRSMPSAGDLNPHNTSTDSLRVETGNPLLTPSHVDMVKFGYTFNNGTIRLNPYVQYSYRSDMIQPYGYLDGDIYVSSYRNFGHTEQLQTGITLSYNIPQGKPYYGNVSVNAYYQKDYIKGMPYSGDSFSASVSGYIGYKKISVMAYLGLDRPNYTYSLYTKSKNSIFTNFELSWAVTNSLRLKASAEKFLWPKMHSKAWTSNGDFHAYTSSVQTSLAPKICIGIQYNFVTKNFKWRDKKQFYDEDNELQTITTK
ncbi:MAG: TonB-dependent receptor [Muribaculaceae bacterium]|nr:TonB-dependent receptor [Muribaculaceae bacterium]